MPQRFLITAVFFLSAFDNVLLETKVRAITLPRWPKQIRNWAALCVLVNLFAFGPTNTSSINSLDLAPFSLMPAKSIGCICLADNLFSTYFVCYYVRALSDSAGRLGRRTPLHDSAVAGSPLHSAVGCRILQAITPSAGDSENSLVCCK